MEVEVHELTSDPNAAWKKLSKKQRFEEITLKPPTPEIPKDKVRVVCMSDTHSLTDRFKFDVPNGDIFIHAGDFTGVGKKEEVIKFNSWIGSLPHKHKLVIAGNHELTFDPKCKHPLHNLFSNTTDDSLASNHLPQLLTNCRYLQDQLIELYGLKIYGSPWQPEFGNWAFNLQRGQQMLDKWNNIPASVDILITHGPPIGHGDLCQSGGRAGCVELLSTIQQRVKPQYHIFGHIHEGYGVTSDGNTIFVNASTCNLRYMPNNPPIVFDIDMPKGMAKGE